MCGVEGHGEGGASQGGDDGIAQPGSANPFSLIIFIVKVAQVELYAIVTAQRV